MSGRNTVLWSAATSIAITDTAAHNSDAFQRSVVNRLLFQAISTHNQSLTLTGQGSLDNTNWTDLPGSETLSASSSVAMKLSDPWIFVRFKAQASVAPGSGSLTIHFAEREVAA